MKITLQPCGLLAIVIFTTSILTLEAKAGYLTGSDNDFDGLEDYVDDAGNWWSSLQAWETASAAVAEYAGETTEPAAPVDSDGDGLTDEQEASYGTNPLVADTDGGGVSDYAEVMDEDWRATDPLNGADDLGQNNSDQTYTPDPSYVDSNDSNSQSDSTDSSSMESTSDGEDFWTWGNLLGVVGVVLTVVAFSVEGPVIAVPALIVGLWWLANEVIDYFSDGPDINDTPVPWL